jgi:hypothetical protein
MKMKETLSMRRKLKAGSSKTYMRISDDDGGA